jgi:holo-[acyl-carrier protein] synthase
VIFGIGVDILHQARIQKIWDRHGVKLADKLLCEAERVAFAQAKNPVRFLSMAFAAKEACVKALGSGFQCAHAGAADDAGNHGQSCFAVG